MLLNFSGFRVLIREYCCSPSTTNWPIQLFLIKPVVLNLFHCWYLLNATDVVWDPQVKIEKVCTPE